MNKKLFKTLLLPLAMLSLVGCNNSNGAIQEKDREKIALTLDNYQTYIAVQTVNCDETYCRYYFIGSSICKYNDCSVSYKFIIGDSESENTYVSKLNISGYGETIIVRWNYRIAEQLKVVSLSGTVEVLY